VAERPVLYLVHGLLGTADGHIGAQVKAWAGRYPDGAGRPARVKDRTRRSNQHMAPDEVILSFKPDLARVGELLPARSVEEDLQRSRQLCVASHRRLDLPQAFPTELEAIARSIRSSRAVNIEVSSTIDKASLSFR
jgi:hypothetical protein